MDKSELARYIDLTLLKPDATTSDINLLCALALTHRVRGVCVNPTNVSRVAGQLANTGIVPIAVVGFPLGATFHQVKRLETVCAIEEGAREIDMVMDIGAFKDGRYREVTRDIGFVYDACAVTAEAEGLDASVPLKVIIETALLRADEIMTASRLAADAGAAFVKTSTGNIKPESALNAMDRLHIAVRTMRQALMPRPGVEIKASGGIKTREQALGLIAAGATRLGVSDVSGILV